MMPVMRAPLIGLITFAIALTTLAAAPPPTRGAKGMVAADNLLASQAGAEVIQRGGNAVDAAIAAALSSGVVMPSGSGLGGGGFAVVSMGGQHYTLDFREVAPAKAHRDMFLDARGEVVPKLSTEGGLAVAVPSEGRGLSALHRKYGRLTLAQIAAPAVRQATEGFEVGAHLAGSLSRLPGVAPLLFGAPTVPNEGELVRRVALASTIRTWAKSGGEALNVGPIAKELASAAQAAGGVLTAEDLAAVAPKERAPLVGKYRGYTLVTMPPPSSGGAVLLQLLAALEGFEIQELGHNSSAHVHLLAELMKHAYADRARVMGDPDFVKVPVDALLAPARIAEIQRSVWPSRTFPSDRYGAPIDAPRDAGTLHVSALDASGLAVALTTTINTSFGSQVFAPKSGVLLNNQMDDFVAKPGVPNAFGLIGLESNAITPGKRPLSSMTPTIVYDAQGRVVMVVGASGGSTIISATLQIICNVLDFGMDPAEALAAPRMHHQWMPDLVNLDVGFPEDVVRGLESRGHTVKVSEHFSAAQVIVWGADGQMTAASDPRKGGAPAAAR